uniref:Ig-like domain-containing protein n=1 Tax=Oryctolagus cuniculus TaxID=9986 RepID=A0A5F9CWY4_RABIT
MILAPEGSTSGTLRIPAARERDAGVYTCRAINELGDATAEIQLEVGHAPRLTELPRNVTVELGTSAFLACRATGRPPPKVTWRRADGQPLGPRQGSRTRQPSGVLFLESVGPEDQALYICEARNVFGKVQAEAQLTVTGHVAPEIASSASTVRVLEGQPVSLSCIILAGRPLPERHWLKDGRPLPPGRRPSVRADGSLHLDRVLQEDAGSYSCVVTNTAGSRHRDVMLVVQVPPRIHPTATHHVTNEGVPASLPCLASGVPTPTITWTKETKALTSRGTHYNVSKDGTLVIAQPSARDAGAYVCTATNAVGFSSQEMRLSVNTKPRVHGNGSLDTDVPLRVVVKAGEEVTLDCEAWGSPPPLVTWTKDSHPVLPGADRHGLLPSGSLRLAQAQAGDSGHYECTASNPAGSASRRYVLRVQGRAGWWARGLPGSLLPAPPPRLCARPQTPSLPTPSFSQVPPPSSRLLLAVHRWLHLSHSPQPGAGDAEQRPSGDLVWGAPVGGEPMDVGLRDALSSSQPCPAVQEPGHMAVSTGRRAPRSPWGTTFPWAGVLNTPFWLWPLA